MWLQEGLGSFKASPRVASGFHGKAGNVGRDLEQDAAGLAEVDGAEGVAILLLGRMHAMLLHQLARHLHFDCIVGSSKGDVMHGAATKTAGEKALGFVD